MSELSFVTTLVRAAVDRRLHELTDRWRSRLPGEAGADLLGPAQQALSGGKRMRPVLAAVGMTLRTRAGRPEVMGGAASARLGAALELYQASALVHDDVIDAAPTRRGLPAAHRSFSAAHRQRGWRGRPGTYGTSAALVLGDWLLSQAGLEMGAACAAARDGAGSGAAGPWRARELFDRMTAEVAYGQFLDVRAEVVPLPGEEDPAGAGQEMLGRALEVVRRKSARYSVMQPLLLGALLAGTDPDAALLGGLARFGEEVGTAFQLRDDELGVFGDPAVTGKPAGEDLREGKRTALLALTWQRTDTAGRDLLRQVLTSPGDGTGAAARLIEDCGARAAHEDLIASHRACGLEALEAVRPLMEAPSAALLEALADRLTRRSA